MAQHANSHTGYRVRVTKKDVRMLVADRVFAAPDGGAWIVEYKTSNHEGTSDDGFLDGERKRYENRLLDCARALGNQISGLGFTFRFLVVGDNGSVPSRCSGLGK